ncbi:bifunctional hydroxymethylpyrimidine kinase/phosphomethylpyrimidine kinase [Variovorax sp. RHLX14]|uniref:bifunctional hydroxymethylpyrimidine kinase/phosphomethylpyrimidine kinase n=1 Tax=Variovorax sp. RHLX14 TaxID=1259731 RepID=UPI003F452871
MTTTDQREPIHTIHTTRTSYPRVLSIAGSDSGGGAGIQADLKTFAALGCHGMTAITALTAQNTLGVSAIQEITPAFLKAQIQAVVEDIGVDAVKLGMLPTPAHVEIVAWAIDNYRLPNVVLDTVMVASSGHRLTAADTAAALVRELFPRCTLVTPNLDEAASLIGHAIEGDDAMDKAAEELLALGARAVLLKGGHLRGDALVDVLMARDSEAARRFVSSRIASLNLHGTGCTLSSAIAAHLALGHSLADAVERARTYVRGAIAAGADVVTGNGSHGPLNHGFAPVPMQRLTAKPLR